MKKAFEELDIIYANPEIDNDTDLSINELDKIAWKKGQTEKSDFSAMTATSYVSPDGTIVKKIFSDGYIEYYYA